MYFRLLRVHCLSFPHKQPSEIALNGGRGEVDKTLNVFSCDIQKNTYLAFSSTVLSTAIDW